jgi:hypothetical protein
MVTSPPKTKTELRSDQILKTFSTDEIQNLNIPAPFGFCHEILELGIIEL